ncbi:MAG: sialate O-acetylesterase, partial [Eubacteriales bacterium]|nr:sialate O-acetylesterase [Eubacteriales bacterium]
PIDPEMVLEYDFEELTEDNKVVDTSGKGNDGTFSTAGIYQSVGYRGKGAHAGSMSDTYIYSDKVMEDIDGANAITVAGWFNNDVLTSSTDFNFFNFLIDGGSAGFKANINKASDTSASQKIVVGGRSVKDDGWLAYSTNFTWQTSKQWHHFAFVIDYKNKYLGVFIDGEEKGSGTAVFKSNKFVLGSPQAHAARFGGGGSATFNGYMDEIKVYNYRLANEDILALASDTRIETQITSFKVGGVEYSALADAKISDPTSEFGAVVALSEPVQGIEAAIESPVTTTQSLYINDVLVSDPASVTVRPGDVLVFMVKGDLWEELRGYKISFGNHPLQATSIVATDRYGTRTNYKTEGKMTFHTKVKNNAQSDTVTLLAALYDIESKLLLDISLFEQEIPVGGIKELSTSLTLPKNYNEVELKVFVWNKANVPIGNTTVFELEPVDVTELTMPSIFGSNSVLQRDEPIHIFGKAVPGSVVSVSFAGHEVETTADFKGDFVAVLPAMPANATGQTLTVTSLEKTLTFDNILIGDVWVLGGQSNMRWSLSTTTNAAEDIADADNYPNIRYFDQDQAANSLPQDEVVGGNWTVASSATANRYSGVGYLFGRELYKALGDVPIGLLSASYGGSRAEAWMSLDTLEKDPRFLALDGRLSPTDIRRPTYLYNAMVHPLLKYNVKGVVFYQGEGNSYDGALYKDLFVALVNDWREKWNRPELPFIYAQISASVPTNPNEQRPLVRQSQLEALDLLENAAMVVTMDIGTEDIHPPHKFPVAQRMALAARGMVYGHDVVYKSPSVESVTYNGSTAILKFKDVANGLDTSMELAEFVLVDSQGTKYAADAQFQGNDTIVVSAQGIEEIAQILYAFDDFPEKGVTIWSICDESIRLPASPFRIIR